MNVLSLFDGMSGARIALDNVGIECTYYSSEIDRYANAVSEYHYPDIIRLGDITNIKGKDLPKIDLIIGGSPCQGFSVSGLRKGFKDKRSRLFFEFVRLIEECSPPYFILENVKMKKEYINVISNYLKVEPVLINSSLVTAQNRKRLYWANFPISQPTDRGIVLSDIIENGIVNREKSYCIDANYYKGGSLKNYLDKCRRQLILKQSESRLYPICLTEVRTEKAKELRRKTRNETGKDHSPRREKELVPRTDNKANCLTGSLSNEHYVVESKPKRIGEIGKGGQGQRIYSENGKSVCLSALGGGQGAKTGLYAIAQRGRYNETGTEQRYEVGSKEKSNAITSVQKDSMLLDDFIVRKLTPIECERLQGVPYNFTKYGILDGSKVVISNTQRYKLLGNGFTIPVIEHILKEMLCTQAEKL